MSAQACYPGDAYPYPHYPAYPLPQQPGLYYGSSTTYLGGPQLTEDRIREIFREELTKALEALTVAK